MGWMQDQGTQVSYAPLHNMMGHQREFISDERNIDILFIGSVLTGNRKANIEKLRLQGIKIECFGNGTERGRVTDEEYWRLLTCSKFVLNFTEANAKSHLLRSEPSRKYVKQAKGRPFEALLCGAHVISERSSILSNALARSGGITFVDNILDSETILEQLAKKIKLSERKKYREFVINNFGITRFVDVLNDCVSNKYQTLPDDFPVEQFSQGYGAFVARVYVRLAAQCLRKKNFRGSYFLMKEYFNLRLHKYLWDTIMYRFGR